MSSISALGDILCPADIKSFSAGPHKNYYYTCNGEGSIAELTNCPVGQYYRASTMECKDQPLGGSNDDKKDEDIIEYTSKVRFFLFKRMKNYNKYINFTDNNRNYKHKHL